MRKSKNGTIRACSARDGEVYSQTSQSSDPTPSLYSLSSGLQEVSPILESGSGANPIQMVTQMSIPPNVQPALVTDTSGSALQAAFFANVSCNSQLYCTSIPMYSVYHYGSMSLPQVMYPGPTVF